jgi:hypothetical protein
VEVRNESEVYECSPKPCHMFSPGEQRIVASIVELPEK